jgi:hypothetical protein
VTSIAEYNRGNVYEVRARSLDKVRDGGNIAEMVRNRICLLVVHRDEYFKIFSMKGASPPVPEVALSGYDILLLVEEIHGESRIQVQKILSRDFNHHHTGQKTGIGNSSYQMGHFTPLESTIRRYPRPRQAQEACVNNGMAVKDNPMGLLEDADRHRGDPPRR